MLLYDIDVNKGGIMSVMLSRSAELSRRYGYDVDLISLDYKPNYDEITRTMKKDGRLFTDVNIFNVYDYYRKKNTKFTFNREQLRSYENLSRKLEPGFFAQVDEDKQYARYFENGQYIKYKKWNQEGILSHIDYFNESRNRTIREEFHREGYISKKTFFNINTNRPKQELYYTSDGFCYLTCWMNEKKGKPNKIFLFLRDTETVHMFKNNKEFHAFWLNELCREQKEKPFLICDGVGSASKVLSMESDAAYRIYTIHTNHFDAPHIYGSPIKEDHVTLLNNIEKEDALVVLTESQKKDIVKQFGDYKNVHVVPNFITPIKNVTFNRNPNLVTMISRYHPEKGIDEAIHAFKKVIQKLPQAKFEIYGHGEDEERLKKLINQLGLSNQVFLKGYTTNVGDVFGKSSLTLLTSKFEGLNVVCLESMSCKVPVVSYDVNYGMSDMIRDGETGYLVKHGDQAALADNIIDLLNHPKKIKEMGQRAYDFVLTNYSKGQVCQKWITLFNELEKAELS